MSMNLEIAEVAFRSLSWSCIHQPKHSGSIGCFSFHTLLRRRSSQRLFLARVGRYRIGCVSGVAVSSSFHTLIVLSASQVKKRSPVLSNVEANMPASLLSEPGWTIVWLV